MMCMLEEDPGVQNNYIQGGSSMKVYRTDEIRNVVLLGHGGSGKTSLVEAMAVRIRRHKPYGKSYGWQYDQ